MVSNLNDLTGNQSNPSTTPPGDIFATTRWSVVLATRLSTPEASAALESICRDYWYPLYAYVRRCGKSPHDAQDLTQEFFCRLLEKRWLDSADREKGRLRTFMIITLKRFMSNEWHRASAQRRGGGRSHAPIDTAFAESRFATDNQSLAPEETFDRQWALTLIQLTADRLREEFAAAGKPGDYNTLKHFLLANRGSIDYPTLAAQLDVNESAARVAVHRLRKRFRQIYREEISQTLAEGEDLEAELRHLAAILAR